MKNKLRNFINWYTVPAALSWDDWEVWKASTKGAHPIQYFFRSTLTSWFRVRKMVVHDWLNLIKYRVHPKHRYHVIKPRSLKPGYHDFDSRIRASAFDLLSVFAEKYLMGDGIKGTKWHDDDIPEPDAYDYQLLIDQIDRESRIIELRNWWVIERPTRDIDSLITKPDEPEGAPFSWMLSEKYRDTQEFQIHRDYYNKISELEQQFFEEDTKKFHELVDLLPHLWY